MTTSVFPLPFAMDHEVIALPSPATTVAAATLTFLDIKGVMEPDPPRWWCGHWAVGLDGILLHDMDNREGNKDSTSASDMT